MSWRDGSVSKALPPKNADLSADPRNCVKPTQHCISGIPELLVQDGGWSQKNLRKLTGREAAVKKTWRKAMTNTQGCLLTSICVLQHAHTRIHTHEHTHRAESENKKKHLKYAII